MSTQNNGDTKLRLTYVGDDSWSRPVYQDQHGHLWKDIDLGDSEQPNLTSATNNEFEGEPNLPIDCEFIILRDASRSSKHTFSYQLLDRLKTDCEYYLGYGNRSPNHLWANDETEQIQKMKEIWLSLPDDAKPEWLTWEQIEGYEKALI